MKKAKTVRFYVSNTDKVRHSTVYETLAFAARRYGLAGATVYKGIMGYGANSELHPDKFWEITEKIPVIVEMTDEASRIDDFLEKVLPWIGELPKECLITCQETEIILVKKGNPDKDKPRS